MEDTSNLENKIVEEMLLTPDLGIEYIKHSEHATIAVNNKATIILVNRSAELMFGYHKSELIGQQIEILLPDDVKKKHEGHRNGYMKKPRSRPMGSGIFLKGRHKDGSEIPVDINLIPVPNSAGMITIAEISRKEVKP